MTAFAVATTFAVVAPEGQSTLGERLRFVRGLAGIGSRELGRLAGVSEGYVSNIESGDRPRVPVDALSRMARVLGASLDFLVDGVGEPPSEGEARAAAAAAQVTAQGAA